MKDLLSSILLFLFFISATAQGEWKTLKTGAGGWITGLSIHPSGEPILARSDVGGAYRLQATSGEWKQIVTAQSMPAGEVDWNRYLGVLSITSAPSNANRAYLAFNDGIFKSDDQGDTWTKTNLLSMEMSPNDDASKLSGERLAVDPINPDLVYFGSINNGLWRSENAGQSWTRINAVPAGTGDQGIRQIFFDSSSGSANGKTNVVLALVDGEDVYRSTDGGSSWASTNLNINGIQFLDGEIDASGQLYVVGEDANYSTIGLRRFDGNSWQQLFTDDNLTMKEIAIDPFDNDRAFIFSNGFNDTYRTTSLSSNAPDWDYLTNVKSAPNIPWMAWTYNDWFSLGEVLFDPVVADKIWMADGLGTWFCSDLEDDEMTWEEYSNQQEHLVSNDIIALPGDKSVSAHWDRPLFRHENPETYPQVHQPSSRFNSSWSIDQSPQNPDWLVAIIEDHRFCCYDGLDRASGYSTDGGQSWTPFASMPGNERLFGQIAVSANDFDNIIWLPVGNRMPYYTTNRGQSWTQVNLPNNSGNCCISAEYFKRLALTADRVLAHTFYLYDWGDGSIFKTTDGGASWIKHEAVVSAWAYHGKLMSVPGEAGHLFFANGPEESLSLIEGLYRSTDGGATWALLPNTDEVLNVAVGKAAPGSDYPSLLIQGKVNGVQGYFQSIDEGQSWDLLGTYPLGIFDVARVLEGDPFSYGKWYVGYGGNGFAYFEADTGPLSVDYVSFYAEDHAKGIELHWESLREENHRGFFVEKSLRGIHWKSIAWIDAEEKKNGNHYNAVDSTPFNGLNYYRLKQVDFDGSSHYSSIISHRYKNWENHLNFYPNPVKGQLTIEGMDGEFSWDIYNSTGQQILGGQQERPQQTLDLSSLSPGLYWVKISHLKNQQSFVKRIVVE